MELGNARSLESPSLHGSGPVFIPSSLKPFSKAPAWETSCWALCTFELCDRHGLWSGRGGHRRGDTAENLNWSLMGAFPLSVPFMRISSLGLWTHGLPLRRSRFSEDLLSVAPPPRGPKVGLRVPALSPSRHWGRQPTPLCPRAWEHPGVTSTFFPSPRLFFSRYVYSFNKVTAATFIYQDAYMFPFQVHLN